MSGKFMAFENEASTSQHAHYYANNYDEGQDERIEMNVNQYPNYQSNEPHQDGSAALGASPYGVVYDEDENDLTDDLQEKERKDVGYRKFIYNNSEQFKPIIGGLILLLGSGIHIVWGIYRVFNLYEERKADEMHYEERKADEMHSMTTRCIIWSWYLGAIVGSICAGFALQKIRKGRIYLVAAVMLIKSGILLFVSGGETSFCLFFSRLSGGLTHGLVYVTILVHASENATKEFREFLVLIVGALLNYALLIAVLCFFYSDGLLYSRYSNCLALITYGICSMIVVAKHSTETVPFLLQNNGSEMDGLETTAKLKKKPIAARSVHHDYLTMRKVVNDELIYYGRPTFGSVFLLENRKSLIFCIFGRLCSVLSFNLPLIVMILLFLRSWINVSVYPHTHHLNRTGAIEVTTMPPVSLKHINGDAGADDERREGAYATNPYHHSEGPSKPVRPKRESNSGDRERRSENGGTVASTTKGTVKKDNDNDEAETNQRGGKDRNDIIKEAKAPVDETKSVKEEPTKSKVDSNVNEVKNEGKNKDDGAKSKEEPQREEKNKVDGAKSKEEPQREEKNKVDGAKSKEEPEGKQNKETAEESKSIDGAKKSNSSHVDSNQTANVIENPVAADEKPGATENHVVEYTAYTHLLIFLQHRELTLVLIAWFIFGTLTVAILYTLNLKRFVYHIACVLCSVLVISGIAHSFDWMTGIMHFALIIYFNYITIPIDLFGHGMLAEAFPITLKAYSIAFVSSLEHFVHIIIIGLYMTEWFRDSIVIFMLAVAYLSHEVATNLPQKSNLTLAEARDEYQNVNLMFFGQPARVNDRERI